VLRKLNTKDVLVWDCETTGLKAYHGSRAFSVAMSDGIDNYYFNFQKYKDLDSNFVLEPISLRPLTSRPRLWIAHNAKFDLHFTDRLDIKPDGTIMDTEVLGRIFNNNYTYSGGYSLDASSKRWLNAEKDDRVKQWMDANNAFTTGFYPDGKPEKHYYFDLVPFDIISEYAMKDAELTFKLYEFFKLNMYENKAVEIETNLTPVLFEIEKVGVLLDREYCVGAQQFEVERAGQAERRLVALCGGEFTDSAKFLAPILEARGFKLPTTEKGNKQITDEVLNQFPGDLLTRDLLEYRDAIKRESTYFGNYLGCCAESDNVIHPNFRQAGTVTGRMSCNQPNLQNIPAEDPSVYPIRRAFIPRPGFVFVSIDYAQMEFRLMLEYANQTDLIEQIKNGLDPHDATANLTGLSRKPAKTLNFGLLYGMGIAKLAKAIGVSDAEAKSFKYKYFDRLPGVKRFIRTSSDRQASRGYTFSWTGRRFYIDDPKWSYKAANSIIQGGCADICKLAMVRLFNYLREYHSRMVLQVHDEILFEIDIGELHIIKRLQEIMAEAYVAQNMPMTCSVSYSLKNFNDMKEVSVDEIENDIRKELSEDGTKAPQETQKHVGI
jgi:DNA polymerase-1